MNNAKADKIRVREMIAKSLSKERLTLAETAALINAEAESWPRRSKAGARELKKKVYGNRIVLFAPLVYREQMQQQLPVLRIQGYQQGGKTQDPHR